MTSNCESNESVKNSSNTITVTTRQWMHFKGLAFFLCLSNLHLSLKNVSVPYSHKTSDYANVTFLQIDATFQLS